MKETKFHKKTHTKYHELSVRIKEGLETCATCGTKNLLSIDHVIPLAILERLYQDVDVEDIRYNLMYNDSDNLQVLCKYHNTLKSHHLDMRNPKTIPLLEKAIAQVKK